MKKGMKTKSYRGSSRAKVYTRYVAGGKSYWRRGGGDSRVSRGLNEDKCQLVEKSEDEGIGEYGSAYSDSIRNESANAINRIIDINTQHH
jgi:hypothetical protein